jgi:hypothetical protein
MDKVVDEKNSNCALPISNNFAEDILICGIKEAGYTVQQHES